MDHWPNRLIPADRNPRERGLRPLNSYRKVIKEMAESSRTTQERRVRASAQPPKPPFGRSNDRLTAETTVRPQDSRMVSLSCSALVKGKVQPARPALGTTCLNAIPLTAPNTSFQQTRDRGGRGPGPLNSNR
jgi:hypothetical protein